LATFGGGQEFTGRDFDDVLEELLQHPDPEVRRVAAARLWDSGSGRSRLPLPVLIARFLSNADPVDRAAVVQTISLKPAVDLNTVRRFIPDLLKCHKAEANQSTQNAIVQILRKLDPKSVWPPIEHQFSFDFSVQTFRGFSGWQVERNSERKGAVWSTVANADERWRCDFPLAQTGGCPEPFLHRFVTQHAGMTNLSLRVGIKAVAGVAEQGGGVLWRHNFSNGTYYAAGISPRDGSLRIYKVLKGDCIQLAASEGLKLAVGEWHDLSVKHVGDKIECSLDGTKYIEVTDTSIRQSGQIGLWTKADAQTYFDGLRATDYGPALQADKP
jgi:hypothetical protein